MVTETHESYTSRWEMAKRRGEQLTLMRKYIKESHKAQPSIITNKTIGIWVENTYFGQIVELITEHASEDPDSGQEVRYAIDIAEVCGLTLEKGNAEYDL
jgi:hypothetical protein